MRFWWLPLEAVSVQLNNNHQTLIRHATHDTFSHLGEGLLERVMV